MNVRHRWRLMSVGWTLLITMATPSFSADAVPSESELRVADAINELGFDLLRSQIDRQLPTSNLVFSPYSVSTALAMTYAGARGDTSAEIATAGHFSRIPGNVHQGFASLSASLVRSSGLDGGVLTVPGRVWGSARDDYSPVFLDVLRRYYGAELFVLDFEGGPAVPAEEINAWISEQTGGHIRHLATPESLNRNTRLLLTSAVYFRAAWSRPFLPESTTQQLFHVTADKSLAVNMMQQAGRFLYLETTDFKLLRMSYSGDRMSFVALLPKKAGQMQQLERSLTAKRIRGMLEQARPAIVDIAIPKFETSTTSSLKAVLNKLGIVLAFSESADMSRVSGKSNLYLSDIAHQAYINVDEKGTEAAAATAVMVAKGLPATEAEFRADHPFVYMIVDDATGMILFLGHVVTPTQSP